MASSAMGLILGGLLLGSNSQVRNWFSQFVRSGQKVGLHHHRHETEILEKKQQQQQIKKKKNGYCL